MYLATPEPGTSSLPACGAAGVRDLVPGQEPVAVRRVALSGELDLDDVDRVRAQLHDAIAAGARSLDVDVSQVTFMDLTTLRALLETDRALRARGGRLRLTGPCPAVRRLLAITATGHLAADATPAP